MNVLKVSQSHLRAKQPRSTGADCTVTTSGRETTSCSGAGGLWVQTWSATGWWHHCRPFPEEVSPMHCGSHKGKHQQEGCENKIQSTVLAVFAHTHTHSHRDTSIHLLQKSWLYFQPFSLWNVLMKLEPSQRRLLRMNRVCKETRDLKTPEPAKTKREGLVSQSQQNHKGSWHNERTNISNAKTPWWNETQELLRQFIFFFKCCSMVQVIN